MVHTSKVYKYASYEEYRDNGMFSSEANCMQLPPKDNNKYNVAVSLPQFDDYNSNVSLDAHIRSDASRDAHIRRPRDSLAVTRAAVSRSTNQIT